MATKIAGLITLDGTFADWPAADMVMTPANTVAGYQVYGAFLNDPTLGNTYVVGIDATDPADPAIGAGTVIYLNADRNNTTGFSPFGNIGVEYEVQFAADTTGALQPYLYSVTSAGAITQLNGGAPLDFGASLSNGESVELAISQALLTPDGGAAPTSINFATLINNGAKALPGDFTNNPEYIIADPTVPPTTIGNLITLDGTFLDWPAADMVMTPGNFVTGYQVYGALLNNATLGNTYVIGINATAATDPAIAPGTVLYLNTDQNTTTGYNLSFGNVGAEYEVQFAYGPNAALQPYLYSVTSGGVATLLNGGAPLSYGFSSNGESVELAISQALLTPAGGAAPSSINFAGLINGAVGLPGSFANDTEYTITDPATLLTKIATHKVAIVYSGTTAANYFRGLGDAAGTPSTAYSDLFMAAQNQARMAGVSYDVIDETDLTNISKLIGYDALIFPAMANVNATQLPDIMKALTSAVYNYHIGIITSGDFLTNDQTGVVLASPYANMQTLLGLTRADGGNSGDVTVTANDVNNPIMKGFAAGQNIIQDGFTFKGVGYNVYQGVGGVTPDVLVNQNVAGIATPLPGVVETTVGGATNVHFATQALLGDSNLLSDAIQTVVLGASPGVALHTSRGTGIVAARMDMDQAQNPSDVSPAGGGLGIYDILIGTAANPAILQQWKDTYNFVGSYYVDIGDNPSPTAPGVDPTTTDWTKSLPYYQEILALGGEIGTHSYTHLVSPPTTTFTANVVSNTSTTITLDQVPSLYGVTVGMWLSGDGIGSTTLPSGAVVHTQVTAVSGNTITIGYDPDGAGPGGNVGTTGALGPTLTFSIPSENTNFLEPDAGTDLSGNGHPFTYAYEFGQSKAELETRLSLALGHPVTIYGAAVPGAGESVATSQNILKVFPSGAGYTGYVTGGWTGIESGYPSAFGYINADPTQQGSVYIAPNMTFDFTEIQYQGNTPATAAAHWAAQLDTLTSHAAGTPIVVWPIHDYGAAAWNTTTDAVNDPATNPIYYTTQMYTTFIAQAYSAGYEFVTVEDLASRIAAQERALINYTTVGNTITATVTDPTAPDLGAMALDVINNSTTQVIKSVTNWYAYNAQELFLDRDGGTFAVTLGTVQDDVTHIAALPMRGDLLSVTGDGVNLNFSMVGDGKVLVDLAGTATAVVTGADTVSQVGDQLTLGFTGLGQHDVTILLLARVTTVAFSADTGASTTDFVTNVATQTITGTLSGPIGATDVVKVSLDNGATWLPAAATVVGTTFSLTGVLLTGSNTLLARVENSAGKFSTPLSQAYVLDQGAPAAPATPDLIVTSDSGLLNTDNITNAKTPTFTGTAEPNSTVTLFDGATQVGTAVATGGTWSIAATTLADGVHSITAKATDLAGNISVASAALPVTIDTIPPAVPSAPNLTPESDTGARPGDNITAVTTPTFTGTAQAGSTVTLYEGANLVGTGVAATNGKWTATATTPLAGGVHIFTAKAADVAGNLSAASTSLTVTIQTEVAPPSTPDLVAGSDSGVLNTDNVTKTVRPNFTGTAGLGSKVTLYDGTTVVGTANANALTGLWTITATTLADGIHNITATATDKSGNLSAPSAALAVTIDTAVPPAPSVPDMTAASDTGVSSTDNITNNKTPTFTGTAEQGSTITIFNGATKVGTAVASLTDGSWSVTTSALANGIRSITTKATDVAGNVSVASAALAVTIDAAVATPSRPVLAAGQDTGVSATDFITKINAPVFTGTAEAGSTVSLFDGTTNIGSATATGGTRTIATKTLPDGVHSIIAQAVDLSGNISAVSVARAVTIDTVKPPAPTFTGGNATSLTGKGEVGATVTVLNGTASLGTATVGAAGNWSMAFLTGTPTGSLTAAQTDKAGNASPASGAALVETALGNTVTGTSGNDFMIGAAGADTFAIGAAFGNDVIADFAAAGAAHDIINFHAIPMLNSFANVQSHTTQVGSASVISDGSGNTLTLNNVIPTSLTAVDFKFV